MKIIEGKAGPIYPYYINLDLSSANFAAVSTDYWKEKKADSNGYAEIPLPQGTYNIYPIKECNTFYPPYLTITISEFQEIVKSLYILDWYCFFSGDEG